MRTFIAGALGLFGWCSAQFLALLLAGGGHGWGAPFLFSMLLFVLYPMTIARAANPASHDGSHSAFRLDIAMLALAVLFDLLLLSNILFDEPQYVAKVWALDESFVLAWVGLWLGWQMLAGFNLALNMMVRRQAG